MKQYKLHLLKFLHTIAILILTTVAEAQSRSGPSFLQASSPEDYVFPANPSPSPNPTPQPVPTAAPMCPYFELNVNYLGLQQALSMDQVLRINSTTPSCVSQMISETLQSCRNKISQYFDSYYYNAVRPSRVFWCQNEYINWLATRYANNMSANYGAEYWSYYYNYSYAYYMTKYSALVTSCIDSYDVRHSNWRNNDMYLDDCLINWVMDYNDLDRNPALNQGIDDITGLRDIMRFSSGPWAPNSLRSGYYCNEDIFTGRTHCRYETARIFLDNACNAIPSRPLDANVCDAGTINWAISPVSLIWEQGYDVDSDVHIVDFPLDPRQTSNKHLWKASVKSPLLVYDPEHSGKIVSAFQLFGNWTFGGKQLASVGSEGIVNDFPSVSAPWKNGFEALASLDADGSKAIEGKEISALGLWFDNNSDGIAQAGEVRTLKELAVLSIRYSDYITDSRTNNITISDGYERLVNGKITKGAAVDWHSYSGRNSADVLSKHMSQSDCGKQSLANMRSKSIKPNLELDSLNANSSSRKNISGLWKWESTGGVYGDRPLEGYFTIKDDESGELTGHTLSIMNLMPNNQSAGSMLSVNKLHGVLSKVKGKLTIDFQVDLKGSDQVNSKATLLEDARTLAGESKSEVSYGGKPVSVKYRWLAKKLN